jgi:hypothetical protein
MSQQFDGLPQGAKLTSRNYRDDGAQTKRWGTQYPHGVHRVVPGDKASRQKADTVTGLNERQLQMHVVDFSRNDWGETGTLHPIDEARSQRAPGRIQHPGSFPQTSPILVDIPCSALNDLHAVAGDDVRQKGRRRGFTFGQEHDRNVKFSREQALK